MERRINPLFDAPNMRERIVASEPIRVEASEPALSPISKRSMKKVLCDGIPAYYDEENRLVLPIMEK